MAAAASGGRGGRGDGSQLKEGGSVPEENLLQDADNGFLFTY